MADSQTDSTIMRGRLREHLHGLLPTAEISEAEAARPLPPLLLLRTSHNLAAFALPNGNWQADYESLYAGFQQLCNARNREWNALDVNFVFCVPQPEPDFDAFCSRVETDVYFCRKFVVPLEPSLPQALARLPFLPLDPLQGTGLRPDSAQVFLGRHAVSPLLARYLVLPHQRGPEEIVNDCLAQEFGEPEVKPSLPRTTDGASDRPQSTLRIEKLEIENFRAYRRRQEFTIASDVTVIYGPNGFGKTSFFDAIDFAVTGGIGRLDALTDAQFVKAATHLDSEPSKSFVALTVENSGNKIRIERTVKGRNHGTLDGDRKDRKSILTALTAAGSNATERIDHLVRLFRATHQFNQEVQELTKEFQKDCRLSADIVSRMLAFEDYNNAVGKAEKVHAHIVQLIAAQNLSIQAAETQAANDRQEIQRLTPASQIAGSTTTLDETVADLRQKLVEAGLTAEEVTVDSAVMRGWRAALTARLADSTSRISRLTEVAKDLPLLPETQRKLTANNQELATKDQAHTASERQRTDADLASQQANRVLTEAQTKLKELAAKAQALAWMRSIKPRYDEAAAQEPKLVAGLGSIASFLATQRAAEEKLIIDVKAAEAAAAQRAAKIATLQKQVATAGQLLDAHPEYLAQRQRLAESEEARRAAEKQLADLQAPLRQAEQNQSPLLTEERRIAEQIKQATEQETDLKRLLMELSGHVQSGVCPVCAADYGAKDRLLERMQKHSQQPGVAEVHQHLHSVREKLAAAKTILAELVGKKALAEQHLKSLETEKASLTKAHAAFTRSAEDAGLFPESPDGHFADLLRRKLASLNTEITQLGTMGAEEAGLPALREALARNQKESQGKLVEQEEKTKTLAALRIELGRIRNDPRFGSLDSGLDQLLAMESANNEASVLAKERQLSAEKEVAAKKEALTLARQALATLTAEITGLRSQINQQKKWVTELEARINASELPADLTAETLAGMIGSESQLQANLALLNDSATNLELALDAATTAAALSRLADSVHLADKNRATAEAERALLTPWAEYFEQLRNLLSAQQNTAIATFTREYGPRASVIQRRLRSVYGFDDITLTSEGSDILVRATRRGDPLRPIDYFSQSQQQTLMLALFLTACSSQTWSSFCPVLLDDPVTHFDDLNTYAFLDLIVGLVESRSGPRQFIVSTCDERLYQLARQKFRHLGPRAAFHTFLSSGKDGPEIETITPSGV